MNGAKLLSLGSLLARILWREAMPLFWDSTACRAASLLLLAWIACPVLQAADDFERNAANTASSQASVAERFTRLEATLLKLSVLEKAGNPRRATLLEQALGNSRKQQIQANLAEISKLITQKKFSEAAKKQVVAEKQLEELLKFLTSEDRFERLKSQQEKLREQIAEVERLIRLQRSLQGENESGADAGRIAREQDELSKRTQKLDNDLAEDEKPNGETDGQKSDKSDANSPNKNAKPGEKNPNGENQPEKKPGENKPGEQKPGEQKPQDANQQPGNEQPGEKQPGQENKPSDANKPSEQKPGEEKPADPKEDPNNQDSSDKKPNDQNKPGEQQPGEKNPDKQEPGQQQDNQKPGQKSEPMPPMPGQNGSSEQSDENEQDPQQQQNPVRRQLQQARKRMEAARKELEKANRKKSQTEQAEAQAELEKAKAELERILRQLREEELERTLASLEARLKQMIERQTKVNEQSVRFAEITPEARTREVDSQIVKLGSEQNKIAIEAERAVQVLQEEGSSTAFPLTMEQVREDMLTVGERLATAKLDAITLELEGEVLTSLQELLAAMEKAKKEQQERKQQQQQQQQDQQQQGEAEQPLVSEIAELKMIRTLQIRVNTRTQRYAKLLNQPDDPVGQANTKELIDSLDKLGKRELEVLDITRELIRKKSAQ
jgi:hypothetical protein